MTDEVLTELNHLLPVGVPHVVVDHLLAMGECHCTGTGKDRIGGAPQRLDALSRDLPGAGDKGGGVAGITHLRMPVDMHQPDTKDDDERSGHLEPWGLGETFVKMYAELADDVVEEYAQDHAV